MGKSPEKSNSSKLSEKLGAAEGHESYPDANQIKDFEAHYQTFSRIRAKYPLDSGGKIPADAPSREILERFTVSRLHELSTDLHDEALRRLTNDPEFPYLLSNKIFPSKRNKRRKRLSTFSAPRIYGWCSVVRDEIVRRCPKVKEALFIPREDQRLKFKVLFQGFTRFLFSTEYSPREPRFGNVLLEKLSRLTVSSALEISTDFHDEVIRRMDEPNLPCLRLNLDFIPSRNQSRQALASIPSTRMQDICSEVCVDIARRFPDFISRGDKMP